MDAKARLKMDLIKKYQNQQLIGCYLTDTRRVYNPQHSISRLDINSKHSIPIPEPSEEKLKTLKEQLKIAVTESLSVNGFENVCESLQSLDEQNLKEYVHFLLPPVDGDDKNFELSKSLEIVYKLACKI